MSATTFIYCLTEPGTKTIRYFGKADNLSIRLKYHIRDARYKRGTHVFHWIQTLLVDGKTPGIHALCEVPKDDFSRFERAFITLGRATGLTLTNIADGGDSPPRIKTELACARMRIKKSTNTSGFVGAFWVARLRKWRSVVGRKGKIGYVGMFSKLEDAVFARNLTIANL